MNSAASFEENNAVTHFVLPVSSKDIETILATQTQNFSLFCLPTFTHKSSNPMASSIDCTSTIYFTAILLYNS